MQLCTTTALAQRSGQAQEGFQRVERWEDEISDTPLHACEGLDGALEFGSMCWEGLAFLSSSLSITH